MLFARLDLTHAIVARTAGAIAGGVAALHDKTGHHPVEGQIVVETVVDQLFEILNSFRRNFRVGFDNYGSPVSIDRGVMACIAQNQTLRGCRLDLSAARRNAP